ncbi:transmembrane protein [Mycobacterium tuberculosis]|nr:transmembrane protein [Mycobacterium tuberculosis]
MMFVTGIVLFALAILISVALHECGHMWVARRTGMKVRRYFVGFGPTLWSTRRGETEYGVKAVPLGGFCDIAGMTPVEELDPDERDRAMYKQATWKRVAVLFAGPGMNLAICLVLIYAIALVWGLPNLHPPTRAVIGETGCVAQEVSQGKLEQCTGPGPAALAGIRSGDVVVKVGDTPVSSFDEMAAAVRKSHGSVPIVVERTAPRLLPTWTSNPPNAGSLTGRAVSSSRQRSVRLGWAPPGSGLCATACSPPCRPHSRSPAT